MSRHFVISDFDAAWEAGLRDWFVQRAEDAWMADKPIVVCCPHSSLIAQLKQRLLEDGLSALGIHFLTPGGLRRLLSAALPSLPHIALREDLHLLARLAAETFPDEPVAQSIAAEPSAFIQALDALEAAGSSYLALPNEAARAVAKVFQTKLKETGLESVRTVDWKLFKKELSEPILDSLLALGFSSADWAIYPLLRAAHASADAVDMYFLAEGVSRASEIWTGTWEQVLGPVEGYLASDVPPENAQLADCFASHTVGGASQVQIAPFLTQSCEVEAIVQQALRALADNEQARLCIVLPQEHASIGREISLELARRNIPHHDRPGHRPGHTRAQQGFQLWAEYQRNQSIGAWQGFHAGLVRNGIGSSTEFKSLVRQAEQMFQNLLTSDLVVLRAYEPKEVEAGLAKSIAKWPLLPREATLREFTEETLPQLETLGWPEDLESLHERLESLGDGLGATRLTRSAFLGWLEAVADIPGRTRDVTGREPFAPIQILTLPEAAGQHWTHLIFAGMTHEAWAPELRESPYLPEKTLFGINARAILEGPQGEGHLLLKPGSGWLPSRSEEARRSEDFIQLLLGSDVASVFVTLAMRNPANPSLIRQASEWYLRLYAASQGQRMDAKTLRAQSEANEAAVDSNVSVEVCFPEIQEAYTHRMDATTPFDGYTYCLESSLEPGWLLSASAWEKVFESPIGAWYDNILHLPQSFEPEKDRRVRMSQGIWTHAWLSAGLHGEDWQILPELEVWQASIQNAAQTVRIQVDKAYTAAGRKTPDAWQSLWEMSLAHAHALSKAVADAHPGKYVKAECRLPERAFQLTPDLPDFKLSGRMDLVVSDRPLDFEALIDVIPESVEVIDFKTGSNDPLSKSRLKNGDGLQLAIYTLALHDMTQANVGACLLRPDATYKTQMNAEDMLVVETLWQALKRIRETGAIGDQNKKDDDFSFSARRPLAEISIPQPIKSAKWVLTHPERAES